MLLTVKYLLHFSYFSSVSLNAVSSEKKRGWWVVSINSYWYVTEVLGILFSSSKFDCHLIFYIFPFLLVQAKCIVYKIVWWLNCLNNLTHLCTIYWFIILNIWAHKQYALRAGKVSCLRKMVRIHNHYAWNCKVSQTNRRWSVDNHQPQRAHMFAVTIYHI
jgi:hypothetical protein